MYILNTQCW